VPAVLNPAQSGDPYPAVEWRKRRDLVRKGMKDLEYLPRPPAVWSATMAALAYSRQRKARTADLNRWAMMHGLPGSARYAELGQRALVLWHGTSAVRAEKIRQVGLFPKKGVWATAEPKLAHNFSRSRGTAFAAGSAMFVLVFDREAIDIPFEMASERDTLRFRSHVGPENFEYVLWDDRIDFVGVRPLPRPKPWGKAGFKRVSGRWVPRSLPPVRFDADRSYEDLSGWVDLSVRRVLEHLGRAGGVEIFSSLYATIDPPEALCHDDIFAALDRLCRLGPAGAAGARLFSLKDEPG